jgi:gliding motility-associated-like protein
VKYYFLLLFLSLSLISFSQGEANIWYFGENAGLDFNNSSPTALTDGQLVTDEGCATISNSNGELLFYTDGTTVYNKNHQIMLNGSGLMGHPSSAQSATIVPKPSSSHLFYIFTTDNENDPNGFRFSVVDLNLDSGNGAVTNEKNILVYTPSTECLGVTKHGNGIDFWIITHGWNSNSFIAYQLTTAGLMVSPVITNIGQVITGSPTDFVAAGTIKVSPSGSKLAFASVSDIAQLFDFNNLTGVLSNVLTLITEPGELLGAAFSPDESLLYISNSFGKIHQFNLNATDIPSSINTIYNSLGFPAPGQLQVGPDNKIYIAFNNRNYLGVLNNPNEIGMDCNFQLDGIFLNGKRSKLGLPSFNQSIFFTPSILLSSNCEGESSIFSFTTSQTVLSASWDFGDGNTSTVLQPTHTYSNAGTYTVSVTIVTPFGAGTNQKQIIIFPKPIVVSTIISLKQCDDDNDGFSAFNLSEANELVVSSTSNLSFSYFETFDDALNNLSAVQNSTTYNNNIVSVDEVFIRVENNYGCFIVVTLNLIVSTTLISNTIQEQFTVCDDVNSGSISDGIATFDFSSINAQIVSQYPIGQQLDITYYRNQVDALAEVNAIVDISNYTNVGYPTLQAIFVRVDSRLNNECLGLGYHVTLLVEPIPLLQTLSFTECDDDQDGILGFNTADLQTTLLNSNTNVTVNYWDENGFVLPSPLPNPFYTNSQTVKVRATNNTITTCFYETTITFNVDLLPIVNSIPSNFTVVCDDEINPQEQDGIFAFDTSTIQNSILGGQLNMIVNYFDEAGNPLSSPLPNSFVSSTQTIMVEVINSVNNNCKATGLIFFVVNEIPIIELEGSELICSNNPLFTKVLTAELIDETLIENYFYQWFKDDIFLFDETNYSLTVNSVGNYSVNVTNSNNCIRTRTIAVTASNIASIESIEINDLSNYSNSITILVAGSGDYVYSLDNTFFQVSNTFVGIEAGIYSVYVKDLNGCGIATDEISVLGIPKYFTPNGDGYNDFWNIKGFSNSLYSEIIIYVFDRFGKLLVKVNPSENGWDGSLDGLPMPATDYWYSIKFQDGRIIHGHFALKR